MLEMAIPVVGLVMLLAALSRMRREMYGTGMLFMAAGLALLFHTGLSASESGMGSSWISPALCVTQSRC